MIDKLSDTWICQSHSKEKISSWVKNLKYFYFKRAWGGHANDGDEFITHIDFDNDLKSKLITLGLEIKEIPDDYPRPVVGKSYTGEEYSKFKSEIPGLKIEQPCHISLFGIKCFVYVTNGIEIKLSGGKDNNPYEVSDVDFENCMLIEKELDRIGLIPDRSGKYETSVTYLTKRLYEDYYK
jgi:hypothetical protein